MESEVLPLDSPAARGVGYRQALQYLNQESTYDRMVTQAIAATRHLAKRQMTWMNHWPSIVHKIIVGEDETTFSQLFARMDEFTNPFAYTRHTTFSLQEEDQDVL